MIRAAYSLAFLVFAVPVDDALAAGIPTAVKVARTTAIPDCTLHVDGAFTSSSTGTAARPFKTITAAVNAASNNAVICVAQGTYAEQLSPGAKPLTLAGGFQGGKAFKVRDSAMFVSHAMGNGSGSFLRIADPAPSGNQLTAIDGFEISGYSQAVVRAFFQSQRFDLTNNFIHDNQCDEDGQAGAGFSLSNVSGAIRNNVIARNRCWRGGGGFLIDETSENSVTVSGNLIDGNAGTEEGISHGGGLYLFTKNLKVTGNTFMSNRATGWGAGLYIGANGAAQPTSAKLAWNIYRRNRAGIAGGGLFCDDGAKCSSDHDIFDGNCGGNIYVDSGPGTAVAFDHLTNVNARAVDCQSKGAGVQIDKGSPEPESWTFVNSIFWNNGKGLDFAASCSAGCAGQSITVSYSMVQRDFFENGLTVSFGSGIVKPADPRFVDAAAGNFHLKSIFGHWTKAGYAADGVSSPALAKGDPASPVPRNPPRAGNRTELGAYGNSEQASYVK